MSCISRNLHSISFIDVKLYRQRTHCELQELIMGDNIRLFRGILFLSIMHISIFSSVLRKNEWNGYEQLFLISFLKTTAMFIYYLFVTSTDNYWPSTTCTRGNDVQAWSFQELIKYKTHCDTWIYKTTQLFYTVESNRSLERRMLKCYGNLETQGCPLAEKVRFDATGSDERGLWNVPDKSPVGTEALFTSLSLFSRPIHTSLQLQEISSLSFIKPCFLWPLQTFYFTCGLPSCRKFLLFPTSKPYPKSLFSRSG